MSLEQVRHGVILIRVECWSINGYLGRPWAVVFNGSNTDINCGSGATLDDIPSGADITVEGWFRHDGGTAETIIAKGTSNVSGWIVFVDGSNKIQFKIDLATTNASGISVSTINDGKWHHFAGYYIDATKTSYISVDGKWENSIAGAGAYTSDAGDDLVIGENSSGAWPFEGAIGWCAISNNDRYGAVAGTDFIPPRQPPAPDGNHVEMWHLDEGTGATANAEVTSPANDGTISNGTWEEQWNQETTPIVPYSLELPSASTSEYIDYGSGANIDDLATGAMSVEAWVKFDDLSSWNYIALKGAHTAGWIFRLTSGKALSARVYTDTTNAESQSGAQTIEEGKWYHVAFTYDDGGTRQIRLWLDGIETNYAVQTAGTGSVLTDASDDLDVGLNPGAGGDCLEGSIAALRVSSVVRWTDTFTPAPRLNPNGSVWTLPDANTEIQCYFRDGAGTTITDSSANGYNGTVNGTTYEWHLTPDMEIDSPGERIFNWGYTIGNDAVDEGIVETLDSLSAGQNYVVRAVAHVESASRGRPKIIIRDETNGADITSLEGPSFHGNHDGLANSATLTDTTARFPQMLVGWTIYNITDGSSATITAISGDMQTITGVLAGGTDNDWDISDEYRIVPPGGPSEYDDYPWIETFTFELPTIARNGTVADCVSISVKMVNGVNEGVIKWHQVELLENLIDNPSVETFTVAAPPVPDGWTNFNYAAGEVTQDAVDFHSGASSLNLAAAASRWMGFDIVGR
ncbi:MAG: LamG domain-containing protein, partial [Candidatus Thorarchaeota archaeon]